MTAVDLRTGQSDPRSAEERFPRLAGYIAQERVWLDAQRSAIAVEPRAREGLLTALGERLASVAAAVLFEANPGAFERTVERLPELQRLLALASAQFRASSAELVRRVADDASALSALLGARTPLRAISDLQLGLSDPHGGGRGVAVLQLDGEHRAVYKPKDLAAGGGFLALCEQLAPRLPLPLHQRWLLVRDGYGFEAFVDEAPCADRSAVERYYLRAGSYLRLLEVLGGRDFHAENVRAAGEHPVLLDLETVISPSGYARGPVTAEQRAWQIRGDSLLATGLVPDWEAGPRGPVDHSGLAIRPRLAGDAGRVERGAFLDAVIDGYLRTASVLRDAPFDALLRAAPALQLRHIERPTPFYTALLARSLAPELLASGDARAAFLRAGLGEGPLVEHELAALLRLDVPLFVATLGDRAVRELCAEHRIELLPGDPFEAIAERAQRAPTPELIESAFATGPWPIASTDQPVRVPAGPPAAERSQDAALRAACEIGDLIVASAIEASGPALSWLGLVHVPGLEARLLHRLPPDLLSGTAGVAVVLARLFTVTADPRYADTARRALQQSLRRLEVTLREPLPPDLDLGNHTGLRAWLYAARECARCLADQPLLARVQDHERAVPPGLLTPAAEPSDRACTADSPVEDLLRAAHRNAPDAVHALHRALELARSSNPLDRLDALELALVITDHSPDHAPVARTLAADLTTALLSHHGQTGRWLPRVLGADQHNLSALFGITALCDQLVRVASPGRFGSLRVPT